MTDQLTKFLALRYLSEGDSLPILAGIFHLTLVRNTGIAFGLFRGREAVLSPLISASLLLLIVWAGELKEASPRARAALLLILGGAVGNWIDRMRVGAVIDFLDFHVWPVFNLADSAITVGVGLYLIHWFRKKVERREGRG